MGSEVAFGYIFQTSLVALGTDDFLALISR